MHLMGGVKNFVSAARFRRINEEVQNFFPPALAAEVGGVVGLVACAPSAAA